MKLRHNEESQKLKDKVSKELKKEEEASLKEFDAEKERQMRQIKDRHAAEISARSDAMSPEELQEVHDYWLNDCNDADGVDNNDTGINDDSKTHW